MDAGGSNPLTSIEEDQVRACARLIEPAVIIPRALYGRDETGQIVHQNICGRFSPNGGAMPTRSTPTSSPHSERNGPASAPNVSAGGVVQQHAPPGGHQHRLEASDSLRRA
ncbi:MAG TPA: hypothetical protein VNE42_10340 [Acidimicrobiales bacterium]|nr:hypothetical protein [Acidimicrobiales bacterium]